MNAIASPMGMQSQLSLAARILMALLFLINGFAKFTAYPIFVAYIGSKGLPFPDAAAVAAGVLEIGASALLIAGWKTRSTALVLALYTLFLAFAFHDFWQVPAAQVVLQKNMFFKNISIVAGLLMMAAWGPGNWSVDKRSEAVTDPRTSPLGA